MTWLWGSRDIALSMWVFSCWLKKWNDCHTVIMANHGRIATGLSRMHQSLCVAFVLSLHCHRVTLQCIFTICAQSSVEVLGARPLPSS